MRFKELFTVPAGQAVTDRHLRRVLVSSICGILLCMVCLVSTTWAWFAASIENTGNVIQIANVALQVTITPEGENPAPVVGSSQTLAAGVYRVQLEISNEAAGNKTGAMHPVYVVMTTSENQSWCWKLEGAQQVAEPSLQLGKDDVTVSFAISWIQPDGATLVELTEQVSVGTAQDGQSAVLPAESTGSTDEA